MIQKQKIAKLQLELKVIVFIEHKEALNVSAIARAIKWEPQNMSTWMKDSKKRPIPGEKLDRLVEYLKDYGFKP